MRPSLTSSEALPATAVPKKRSKAQQARDLRRSALRNAQQQDTVRTDRVEAGARSHDVNEFMAQSLDRRQHELDAEKLGLRRDARAELGVTENESFRGRSRG